MSSFASELSATTSSPVRVDLSGAYLVVLEAAGNDLYLSFHRDGFNSAGSYRTLSVGTGLVLDLPRPAQLEIWARGGTGDGALRVMVFR